MIAIEEALAALRAGDLARVGEFAHPDIELDLSRRVLNPDVYRGFDGLARFRDEVVDIWDEMRLEPLEIVESGDNVLIHMQAKLTGKGSGVVMETEIFHVWTIRDGLIVRIVILPERDEAERLAGLR